MTYRELLEAIRTAHELENEAATARNDPKRFNGTPEERDDADSRVRSADAALDREIDALAMTDNPAANLTATEIAALLKQPQPLPGDHLLREVVDDRIALLERLGLLPRDNLNPP